MNKGNWAISNCVSVEELKSVRKMLGMSQAQFAKLIGVSKPTIERWETSKSNITGPIVMLIKMLKAHPEYIQAYYIEEKEFPIRLYYMHNNDICSVIDVDDVNRKVKVKDFTDNNMLKAFGCIKDITYEKYEEFLEDRCFPKSRDKMKLILEDMNLPYYDPFLIIEKTEGRMAEDYFWIKIER